jgi:hypothetical protein
MQTGGLGNDFLRRAIFTSSRLPAKVFRYNYGRFQFFEFEPPGSENLESLSRRLIDQSGDETVMASPIVDGEVFV